MKKILFYINTIHQGGAARVMVNLANKFAEQGYPVFLVTSFNETNEYSLNDNVTRIFLEEKNTNQSFIKKNLTRTYKLRQICKKEKPDIIISFLPEPNFRAIIASMFLGIRTLISVRNDPNREYRSRINKIMARLLYPLASGCVFQTEDARAWFSKRIQKKSKIILNHVDEKFFKINFEGKRENIVTVGRLEPQKNHKLLIESFARIADKFPVDKLMIYGDGSQRQYLEQLAKKLGLDERIMFNGATLDIQDRIKNAKLFVLSSDFEGLPNALMEAMTLGLPVISTNCPCGGPKMLIDHNNNGLVVNMDNVGEMATAMERVLGNASFAESLSLNARSASKNFEPNKVFKIWESYVGEIISG